MTTHQEKIDILRVLLDNAKDEDIRHVEADWADEKIGDMREEIIISFRLTGDAVDALDSDTYVAMGRLIPDDSGL